MKANRRFRRADEGISNVLGAILLFGLFVLTLVVIRQQFVPVWDEEREAKRMDAAATQFSHLKAEMDRAATNGTGSPVTLPLTLGARGGGFEFFRGNGGGGVAGFTPYPGAAFHLQAPRITIQESGGVQYFGLEEIWSDMTHGQAVTDIERVLHLRVKVPDPLTVSNQRVARIDVTGGDGNPGGALEIKRGGDALYVYTYNAAGTVVSIRLDDTDPESWDSNGPDFFFNLLDDNVLFAALLDAAPRPLTLTMSNPSSTGIPSADFNIVYDKRTATGTERVGGDIGLTLSPYSAASQGGALQAEFLNAEYPQQTYTLENGAVFREQGDGAVMHVPPAFRATRTDNQASLSWAIPVLDGSDAGLDSREVSITMEASGSAASLSAFAPSFTVTLATAHPALWKAFWRSALDEAGFLAGEYALATTAGTASLTLYGPVSAPSSTVNDILLDLRQATIDIQLRPTG